MGGADLNDVAMFVRVVRRGGFAAAARELSVPTSTVSRAVARLEERLGTRLLQRTTRAVRTTAEGRDFFAGAAPALASIEQAAASASTVERTVRGTLRVLAPAGLGGEFLARVVARFTAAHPEVEVSVELSSRAADLVAEGIDLAIRIGALEDSSLVARRFSQAETVVVASSEYVARHGLPKKPQDLANHAALLPRAQAGRATWTLRNGRSEAKVDVRGRIAGDDIQFLLATADAGSGVALLPRIVCSPLLDAGRLVHLLPGWTAAGPTAWIVYPSAKHLPAKTTAFRDLLLETQAQCEGHPRAGR